MFDSCGFVSSVFRLLDANLNRAREALRVVEDFARFVLDDSTISGAFKIMRHELVEAVPPDVTHALAVYRDAQHDVGRTLETESEYRRTAPLDVAIAATKRLAEALRSIEEYAKIVNANWARRVEELRYETYELEQRLTLTVRARERFGQVRLYVIITESLCANDWFDTARAVIDGGAQCLQLREKELDDRELLRRASQLSQLCRSRGVLFVMNDRPDIAIASHADGVHVGQDDLPVSVVRRMIPPSMLIGVSTHTIEQAQSAIAESPDYLAIGPMFESTTKPQKHIAGLNRLHAVREMTSLPIVAIGGITPNNIAEVRANGAACICGCSAVISQPDPARAAAELLKSL